MTEIKTPDVEYTAITNNNKEIKEIKFYRIKPIIGKIFNLGISKEFYVAKESNCPETKCDLCCFNPEQNNNWRAPYCHLMWCNQSVRLDDKDVYFERVDNND